VSAAEQPDPQKSVPEGPQPSTGLGVWKDIDALRTMMQPLRVRAYIEAVKGPVSAKELSDRLEVPLQRMSYHVRLLAEAGLLEVVRKTPRRGAIETHYRAVATLDIDDDVLLASPEFLQVWIQVHMRLMIEDAEHAVEQSQDNALTTLIARAHFVTNSAGRERIRQEVLDFYDRIAKLEEELRVEPDEDAEELNLSFILHPGRRSSGRNGPMYAHFGADRLTIPPD
jgi:DNA-binding transcriptional ArsR family regulator